MVVTDLRAKTLVPILRENDRQRKRRWYTDEASQYQGLPRILPRHDYVRHGVGEYVRRATSTPTLSKAISASSSAFMKGVLPALRKKHLHRYAAEFEFRYNTSDG